MMFLIGGLLLQLKSTLTIHQNTISLVCIKEIPFVLLNELFFSVVFLAGILRSPFILADWPPYVLKCFSMCYDFLTL